MSNEKKRRKKKTKGGKVLLSLSIIVLATALTALLWWNHNLQPVSADDSEQMFTVEAGMTAAQVASSLEERNLIRNARIFQYYCKNQNVDAKLISGTYQIAPSFTLQEIIDVFLEGPKQKIVTVNFPEGYTVQQIVAKLAENDLGSEEDFYQAMKSFDISKYPFMENLPNVEFAWEGFLFPATYYFDIEAPPQVTLSRFLDRFAQELTPEAEARLAEKNMSVLEWVTKASIVEKEAVKNEERKIISGVFEKRLEIGMLLQSCATVQYLLDEVKPVLSNQDIQIESPYNTYKYSGLPPGPVANPGHASLEAALYPEDTDYLYFVAKSDGSHAFSKTYEEHLRNVSRYQ